MCHRHPPQAGAEAGFFQAGFHAAFVILHAGGHILPQAEGKQLEILEDYGKNGHVFIVVIFFDIDPVK